VSLALTSEQVWQGGGDRSWMGRINASELVELGDLEFICNHPEFTRATMQATNTFVPGNIKKGLRI
jgi:hypothetical protein